MDSMAKAPSLTVSAVIPVHNGQDFLAEAIRSVLAQTRPVVECIVVDDGSTDATADIAQEFGDRVTLVRQPERKGVAAARNHGSSIASGDLVAFLDHDDVWLETKLERQLHSFDDPAVTLALCAMQVVDRGGEAIETKRLAADERLLGGMLLFDGTETVSCSSTGIVRRDSFLAMGGFDEQLSMSADWDLLVRVLLESKIGYVDEPLVLYRVHETNMSRRIGVMEADMQHAFGKTFAHPALPADLRRRRGEAYGHLYRMLSGSYRDQRQLGRAARALAVALRHHPPLALELVRRPPRMR
jgi:glycosyltransferase involved in cell wall biosynthesis